MRRERITRPVAALLLVALLAAPLCAQTAPKAQLDRLDWWREARFGMFIHWGLYSVLAGEWDGRQIHGIGECIMANARIPRDQYAALARQFNPVKFNADEWVRVAKDAGMQYIVITAKHHDGFAMYGSKVSPFNVVDATPFHRDPIKELAVACRKAGIRLGFYYSHVLDWHEPDAAGINTYLRTEGLDLTDDTGDFARYFSAKAEPQVRELLTSYGPIGLIWFDWWRDKPLTREQAQEMASLVHRLQPDCLVNGRVGYDLGDYASSGDNELAFTAARRDWEAPATLNDTWGFKRADNNWKSVSDLVRNLVRVVSQNGNYLLNVGPTPEGVIPAPSVERLREVGKWMRVNQESVRGAGSAPFPKPFEWGVATARANRIYLHVFDWPAGHLVIDAMPGRVRAVSLLARHTPLVFRQRKDSHLTIELPPTPPDPYDPIIVLEMKK